MQDSDAYGWCRVRRPATALQVCLVRAFTPSAIEAHPAFVKVE